MKCSKCNTAVDFLDCDCVMACGNNMFCPNCQAEIDPESGEVHVCDEECDVWVMPVDRKADGYVQMLLEFEYCPA